MIFALFLLMAQAEVGQVASVVVPGIPEQASSDIPDENLPTETDGEDIIVSGDAVEPEKVICRREKVIGSTIKKQICRTESQIKEEAEAGKRAARNFSNDYERRHGGDLNSNR